MGKRVKKPIIQEKVQPFHLFREEDESGISGTGIVAYGVIFPSGKVALEWCTFHSSIGIYSSLADVDKIHGHGGKTHVVLGLPTDEKT